MLGLGNIRITVLKSYPRNKNVSLATNQCSDITYASETDGPLSTCFDVNYVTQETSNEFVRVLMSTMLLKKLRMNLRLHLIKTQESNQK